MASDYVKTDKRKKINNLQDDSNGPNSVIGGLYLIKDIYPDYNLYETRSDSYLVTVQAKDNLIQLECKRSQSSRKASNVFQYKTRSMAIQKEPEILLRNRNHKSYEKDDNKRRLSGGGFEFVPILECKTEEEMMGTHADCNCMDCPEQDCPEMKRRARASALFGKDCEEINYLNGEAIDEWDDFYEQNNMKREKAKTVPVVVMSKFRGTVQQYGSSDTSIKPTMCCTRPDKYVARRTLSDTTGPTFYIGPECFPQSKTRTKNICKRLARLDKDLNAINRELKNIEPKFTDTAEYAEMQRKFAELSRLLDLLKNDYCFKNLPCRNMPKRDSQEGDDTGSGSDPDREQSENPYDETNPEGREGHGPPHKRQPRRIPEKPKRGICDWFRKKPKPEEVPPLPEDDEELLFSDFFPSCTVEEAVDPPTSMFNKHDPSDRYCCTLDCEPPNLGQPVEVPGHSGEEIVCKGMEPDCPCYAPKCIEVGEPACDPCGGIEKKPLVIEVSCNCKNNECMNDKPACPPAQNPCNNPDSDSIAFSLESFLRGEECSSKLKVRPPAQNLCNEFIEVPVECWTQPTAEEPCSTRTIEHLEIPIDCICKCSETNVIRTRKPLESYVSPRKSSSSARKPKFCKGPPYLCQRFRPESSPIPFDRNQPNQELDFLESIKYNPEICSLDTDDDNEPKSSSARQNCTKNSETQNFCLNKSCSNKAQSPARDSRFCLKKVQSEPVCSYYEKNDEPRSSCAVQLEGEPASSVCESPNYNGPSSSCFSEVACRPQSSHPSPHNYCALCNAKTIPVEDKLASEILRLIKTTPVDDVALSILQRPDDTFHVSVVDLDAKRFGCFLASKIAIIEAKNESLFENFLTFFVVDSRCNNEQKNSIVKHCFELVEKRD